MSIPRAIFLTQNKSDFQIAEILSAKENYSMPAMTMDGEIVLFR